MSALGRSKGQDITVVAPRFHPNFRGWIDELTKHDFNIKFFGYETYGNEDPSNTEYVLGTGNSSAIRQWNLVVSFANHLQQLVPQILVVRDLNPVSMAAIALYARAGGRKVVLYRQRTSSDFKLAKRELKSSLQSKFLRMLGSEIFNVTTIWSAGEDPFSDFRSESMVVPFLLPEVFWASSPKKIEGETIKVVTVGKFRAYKRLPALLVAFRKALDRNIAIELTVIGQCVSDSERNYLAILRRISQELGILEQVNFMTNLSRESVADELRKHHVFVLANPLEVASVSVLEAAASGLAVLAPSGNGTTCYVADQGIFENSTEGLIAKLSEYVFPEKVENLAQNNFARIRAISSPRLFWLQVSKLWPEAHCD